MPEVLSVVSVENIALSYNRGAAMVSLGLNVWWNDECLSNSSRKLATSFVERSA